MSGHPLAATSSAQLPLSNMVPDETPDFTSWDPERLMREHSQQELKGDELVRLSEYYTNKEVVLKINQNRLWPMHESNYFALLKRACESLALRTGVLPGDFRLELDRRRVANQTARGMNNNGLSFLRSDVAKRDQQTVVTLQEKPTPQQIAAAHEGRDSKDRWLKLIAARQQYSDGELAVALKRTIQVTNDIINIAKRNIKAFDEWDELAAQGKAPQPYIHPPLLQPGAAIYNLLPGKNAGDAIRMSSSPKKSPVKAKPSMKVTSPLKTIFSTSVASPLKAISPGAKSDSGANTSDESVASHCLVSIRVRRALYRLRDRLATFQPKLPALESIAYHLEPSLESISYGSDSDRVSDESCETATTIAEYRAFAASCSVFEEYGSDKVAACLVWAIDGWFEHVEACEHEDIPLGYTFLQCLVGVLGDIRTVQAQMAAESAEQEDAALELATACDRW